MQEVEEERGTDGVLLVLSREHTLSDVPATAGLGTRIPARPPLHGDGEDDQHDEAGVIGRSTRRGGIDRGEEGELGLDEAIAEECAKAGDVPNAVALHGVEGSEEGTHHRDGVLVEVCPDGAGETAEGGVDCHANGSDDERPDGREVEHGATDLNRCERDGRHDQDVEEDAQVERTEPAQDGGGLAGVADFVEAEVGRQFGATPELGVDEDGEHTREQEDPPAPVVRDAVVAHHAGNEVWRVAGEGARHHRNAKEPPGHGASAEEEVRRAGAFVLNLGDDARERADGNNRNEEDYDDSVVKRGYICQRL